MFRTFACPLIAPPITEHPSHKVLENKKIKGPPLSPKGKNHRLCLNSHAKDQVCTITIERTLSYRLWISFARLHDKYNTTGWGGENRCTGFLWHFLWILTPVRTAVHWIIQGSTGPGRTPPAVTQVGLANHRLTVVGGMPSSIRSQARGWRRTLYAVWLLSYAPAEGVETVISWHAGVIMDIREERKTGKEAQSLHTGKETQSCPQTQSCEERGEQSFC